MTTVVSVRGQDYTTLTADPNFVYVGRRCMGWPGSIWGNPFKPGMIGFDVVSVFDRVPRSELTEGKTVHVEHLRNITGRQAIEYYELWLGMHADLLAKIPTLRDKRLACWCGQWEPGQREIRCHAVTLAKLADSDCDLHELYRAHEAGSGLL